MCVLDMPQVCGGGDPAIFVAPACSSTVSLNNVRRCPASSFPTQHPLNCLSFHIRHGFEPNMQDCTVCTDAMKSFPPPQMRQSPVQPPFKTGRYHDGPPLARTNPRGRANDNSFIPGLSTWSPSHAEASASASAGQARQDGLAFLGNHAPARFETVSPAAETGPRQTYQETHQQQPSNIFNPLAQHPPTPPMRPRSRSRNRNDNQVPELTKLLEESLDRNIVLTRENEELKRENANLKSWLGQNGPRY